MTPLESVYMLSYDDIIDKKTMTNVSSPNSLSLSLSLTVPPTDHDAGPLQDTSVQGKQREHCGDTAGEEIDPPGS